MVILGDVGQVESRLVCLEMVLVTCKIVARFALNVP